MTELRARADAAKGAGAAGFVYPGRRAVSEAVDPLLPLVGAVDTFALSELSVSGVVELIDRWPDRCELARRTCKSVEERE
jgi:hypothetical protein